MVRVSGTLVDFVEDPSIVAQVQVRAREVRPHGDGVMLDHPVNVEWDPPTGTVTFDAAAGTAGVIVWQSVGRSRASGSLPLVVPDTPTATLADCVRAGEIADTSTRSLLVRLALQVVEQWHGATQAAKDAKASEKAAAGSEENAATSERNAATSEENAATSERNADASATAAAESERNAATSERNAATSEENALAGADRVGTAEQVGQWAATAETSATTATKKAESATASATDAQASEDRARGIVHAATGLITIEAPPGSGLWTIGGQDLTLTETAPGTGLYAIGVA